MRKAKRVCSCTVKCIAVLFCLMLMSSSSKDEEEGRFELRMDQKNIRWIISNIVRSVSSKLDLYPGRLFHFPPKDTGQLCQFPPENLKGRQNVTFAKYNESEIEQMFNWSHIGGNFRPLSCNPVARVALILPYRNRSDHLNVFLLNIIPKLWRQQIEFTIYLIEQTYDSPFNRGMMRNIGFLEASKDDSYDCYIFNDVDTLMEDDRNMYICSKDKIRHLVAGADRYKYRLPYQSLIGGAIAFTEKQFLAVNGYTNQFFQWGSEDDNLYERIKRNSLMIERPDKGIGLFTTLKHPHDHNYWKARFSIFKSLNTTFMDTIDGLNNVKYTVISKQRRKLYTKVYVRIKKKEIATF